MISLSFSPSEHLTWNFQNCFCEIRLEGLGTRWEKGKCCLSPRAGSECSAMLQPLCLQAWVLFPVKSYTVKAGWAKGHRNSTDNILWLTFLNHKFLKLGAVSICGSAATVPIAKNQTIRHKAVDQVRTLRVKTTFFALYSFTGNMTESYILGTETTSFLKAIKFNPAISITISIISCWNKSQLLERHPVLIFRECSHF